MIDPSVIVPSDPAWSHSQERTGQRGGHRYSSETPSDEGIPSIIVIEGSSIIVIALTIRPPPGTSQAAGSHD